MLRSLASNHRLVVVLGLLVLVFAGCSAIAGGQTSCRSEDLEIREAVARHVVATYDGLPHQIDDPIGRRYCLGFNFRIDKEGETPPPGFLARFSHPGIHGLEWCDDHDGRLLSVGPVRCVSATEARVWSFSWLESRPSGTECLHVVLKTERGWEVQEGCNQGLIYG